MAAMEVEEREDSLAVVKEAVAKAKVREVVRVAKEVEVAMAQARAVAVAQEEVMEVD